MLDPDHFRSVLGRFASGVSVVTAVDGHGTNHGMTASAFCSVSLSPPLVLICIDNDTVMSAVVASASHFAVNLLSASQEAISRRFADTRASERFLGVGFTAAPSGAALLDDVLGWLECRIVARHPAGDHAIIVGEVENAAATEGRQPLVYYRGGYAQIER